MALLDEQALQRDYQDELRSTSLRYGRMMAGVAILVLGYMFINDYFVMDVGLLSCTRMVGFIPGVVFMVLSFTWFRNHRQYIIPAHGILLAALMVSGGLFSVGLFRKGLEGSAYGAAGTMQASVLALFVFGTGVRKYLWGIIAIPLALTYVAILVCCSPTRVEMTLFYTPMITAVCVIAAGVSQARMSAKSFRMARLVELHKDELEEKAEALQLANNELQQFASAVAHDLKVPLHSIRTALETMDLGQDGGGCDETKVAEKMEFVTGTADRMGQMIASMLSYACLENCSEDFCYVSLDEVLEAVKLNLKQPIEDSGAEIATESLPVVWGDRMQLTTLLQEFLVNAIKYTKPDAAPSIRLSAEDEGDSARILVHDNGIGFDAKHKRTVFKPYQQLRTHAKGDGSGIGLASCAKIIKLHGGTIGVDPVLDEGSTFYFTLPKYVRS